MAKFIWVTEFVKYFFDPPSLPKGQSFKGHLQAYSSHLDCVQSDTMCMDRMDSIEALPEIR